MLKNKFILFFGIAILVLTGTGVLPALAQDSEDGGDSTTHVRLDSSEDQLNATDQVAKTAENKDIVKSEAPESEQSSDIDRIHTEGKSIVEDFAKNGEKHSESERQKTCQAAQHGLETKLSMLSKNATAFQLKIDDVLVMAIAYQKDNNIVVPNFDTMLATAQNAKTQSAAAVAALSALTPTLDCTKANVATNVAEFKSAAQSARTSLKAYRTTVKAILVALQAAKGGSGAQ